MLKNRDLKILIKGAGEMASGIAYQLYRNNYKVCLTEIAMPLAVSRATCYSEAVFDGIKTIEGVTARLVRSTIKDIAACWQRGDIPLVIDPNTEIKTELRSDVVIDARMMKKSTDTKITDAALVIGIGNGFVAGTDVHVVVETNDVGGNLGKLIYQGESEPNTGRPIVVGGLTSERVVWASRSGTFTSSMKIGDPVEAGQVIGTIDGVAVNAPLSGHLRGLIKDGVAVTKGAKLIEVDHVNQPETFAIIREKMRLIGSSVLSAIEQWQNK